MLSIKTAESVESSCSERECANLLSASLFRVLKAKRRFKVCGRTALTLYKDSSQGVFKLLLSLLHLLLVSRFLVHQPADVAVGRLDHGVDVVGVAAVHFASLHPGQEHSHRLGKFGIV